MYIIKELANKCINKSKKRIDKSSKCIIMKNIKNKCMNVNLWSVNIFVVIALSITSFMFACQKDDNLYGLEPSNDILYKEYLSIDGFSSKTIFSETEKRILKEAILRVDKYFDYQNDNWVVSKSAKELNMSEDIYNVFTDIFDLCTQNGTKYPINDLMRMRLKSGTETNTAALSLSPACISTYLAASTYLSVNSSGDFAQSCFNNYWFSGGNMTLSQSQFQQLTNSAPTPTNLTIVSINGTSYYSGQVSFYGNSSYALALGSATMYYDMNMNPVGFKDNYDFD